MKKIGKNNNFLIKLGLIVSLNANVLMALEPSTYYDIEIKVMELLLNGAKERLACLNNGCPQKEQYKIYEKIEVQTMQVYKNEGTSPSKHIGYYTKHSKEVDAYYKTHKSLQEQQQTLMRNLEKTNTQIKTQTEQSK